MAATDHNMQMLGPKHQLHSRKYHKRTKKWSVCIILWGLHCLRKRSFQSTKQVADFLKSPKTYNFFTHCSCEANARIVTQAESSESDEDHWPDPEEEAGMSRRYDDTPIKVEDSSLPQPDV